MRVAIEYIPICSKYGALDGQSDEATAQEKLEEHLKEENGQQENGERDREGQHL